MSIRPLKDFVVEMTRLCENDTDEAGLLKAAAPLMSDLIADKRWLPNAFAAADPKFYRQYLLHCDPLQRFSLVSFVWGPGQETPIHDHTTWGLIGVLEGAEHSQRYEREDGIWRPLRDEELLEPGMIDMVSPNIGDIHKVRNAWRDQVSISIHLYGGNIGQIDRHVYDKASGAPKQFRSGYSLETVPNLWSQR